MFSCFLFSFTYSEFPFIFLSFSQYNSSLTSFFNLYLINFLHLPSTHPFFKYLISALSPSPHTTLILSPSPLAISLSSSNIFLTTSCHVVSFHFFPFTIAILFFLISLYYCHVRGAFEDDFASGTVRSRHVTNASRSRGTLPRIRHLCKKNEDRLFHGIYCFDNF